MAYRYTIILGIVSSQSCEEEEYLKFASKREQGLVGTCKLILGNIALELKTEI